MTDLRRKRDPSWVFGLTPEEATEIAKIDARAAAIDEERRQLTNRRCRIQQRANQRVLNRKRREVA